MPSDSEQLATIKSNILARLAEITAQPKPTYTIDGVTWKHTEYFEALMKQLTSVNQQIAAEMPFTELSQGAT
jgi:hypothetical protein